MESKSRKKMNYVVKKEEASLIFKDHLQMKYFVLKIHLEFMVELNGTLVLRLI
jgi:hypothetical protein